ncbi:MAG: hypothetical protein AAF889_00430 [Cyanobacteria bacterium P01_D01_bin.73]
MTSSVTPHRKLRPQSRFTRWSDRLGRWNPQLLRELRGKLSIQSVAVAIATTWSMQALLAYAVFGIEGNQWQGNALLVSRIAWLVLITLMGSLAITNDWIRESKLGTLDFLMLSPEPAWRILLGKLVGVPVLWYVATIAWLPFHLYLAVSAGSDLGTGLAIDAFSLSTAIAFLIMVLNLSVSLKEANPFLAYIATASMFGMGAISWGPVVIRVFPDISDADVTGLFALSMIPIVVLSVACWYGACLGMRRYDTPPLSTPPLKK